MSKTFSYVGLMIRENPDYYAEMKDRELYSFGGRRRVFRGDPENVGTAYPNESADGGESPTIVID